MHASYELLVAYEHLDEVAPALNAVHNQILVLCPDAEEYSRVVKAAGLHVRRVAAELGMA